jgi:mono/diheme cytochrome c family protein
MTVLDPGQRRRSQPSQNALNKGDSPMRLSLIAMIGLSALAAPVFAQENGNPARGLVYARQACADCHAVGPDQRQSPDPKAPSFLAIANIPGMTRTAFNVWLFSSHPSMPQLIVEPDRIDDLAAYLATLTKSRK